MSDLSTLLRSAALPADDVTTTDVADADLGRARRALHRRRVRRIGVAPGLLAAAALGAVIIAGPGPSSAPTATPSVGATTSVELVSYSGAQPKGYSLDKVPSGWQVETDTLGVLTLAPAGTEPVVAPDSSVSLEGRIAIMSQNDTGVPSGVQLDDVRVGDRPGVIAHMKGSGDTRTLFVEQTSGVYLTVQVWDGLGWDNEQIAEFGSSIRINPGAEMSAG